MSHSIRFHELVAATHTPFHADGSLNLSAVERQAEYLLGDGVKAVFIAGTTGESHSLTFEERKQLATRWAEVARETPMRVIVHIGSNCLEDSKALAAHAESVNAAAIAALPPSYFKPRSVEEMVACAAEIANAARRLPFYHYDIPSLTGITLSSAEFLDVAADRIPTLAGIKFTNPDLMTYQKCIRSHGGRFDVPWGIDEHLLGGLAVGAAGAVGSTYNFAAPIYHRLMSAFARGDLVAAREEQFRSVRLIGVLASYGYMGAAKALMSHLKVPVGPPRLPNTSLSPDRSAQLMRDLDAIGFFDRANR